MSKFSQFTVTLQPTQTIEAADPELGKGLRHVPESDVSLSSYNQREVKEVTPNQKTCELVAKAEDNVSVSQDAKLSIGLCDEESQSELQEPPKVCEDQDGSHQVPELIEGGDEKESSAMVVSSNTPSPEPSVKAGEVKNDDTEETVDYLAMTSTKEMLLEGILKKYKIKNGTWMKSLNGFTMLVTFVVESGRKEEDVLDALITCGIGREPGTTVSISPLTVCLGMDFKKVTKKKKVDSEPIQPVDDVPPSDKSSIKGIEGTTSLDVSLATLPSSSSFASTKVGFDSGLETVAEAESLMPDAEEESADSDLDPEQPGESDFMRSIKARIIIQPVVASLKKNAEFTFDYLIFIILASIISAIGLIENNSVVLVASMLISPLMGPILAVTFGTAVNDFTLRNVGVKSELIGLGICILTGFLIGIPVVFLVATDGPVIPSTDSWPSPEMFGRGLPRSLLTGAVIALVSGLAVALSVLGDNQGSLVGVAISASLLPPAVNAGLLWAYALRAAVIVPHVDSTQLNNVNNALTNITMSSSTLISTEVGVVCLELVNNTYKPFYTCSMAKEALYLGLMSLLLTIVNIIMIVLAAMVCLKIKQVSPRASVQGEKSFWTEHMNVAKHYNTTVRPDSDMWKTLLQELRTEMGLTDAQVETINYADSHLKRQALVDSMWGSSTSNIKRLQRTASLPEKGIQRPLDRMFSHQPKLESEKFDQDKVKKSGRFQIIKQGSPSNMRTSVN